MRILIVGAGVTGGSLAERLCAEHHDVVLVDPDAKTLDDLGGRFDIMTVRGSGAHAPVLEQAGVRQTDLLVAVSSNEEVNLLACMYGKTAGVERTVARLSDPGHTRETDWLQLRDHGVDIVVSQNDEGARELFHTIMLPSAAEVVPMIDGRLQVVGVRITEDSPIYGTKLSAFPEPHFLESIRFLAVMRGGKLLVPRGSTVLIDDDLLYFIGRPTMILGFVNWVAPVEHTLNKVVIAGGGGMGLPLAVRLERTNMQCVLIESDRERAEQCSGELKSTLVLNGDALDRSLLAEAGITPSTALVSVTGNDERNILSALLAKQSGAPMVIAQVNEPGYGPIVRNLEVLDRVVNAKETIINTIMHMARWRNKEAYTFLKRVPGELIEAALSPDSKWVDTEVRDLPLPDDALVASIVRDAGVQVPTGDTRLQAGDLLVVFAIPDVVDKAEAVLGA